MDDVEPQALLPGMRRYVAPPKKDWRPWTDGRGQKIDSPRHRGATFYGAEVPLPTNSRGEPLAIGHFRILARTDGLFVVVDRRAPFGDFSKEILRSTLAGAVDAMIACHRAVACKGPWQRVRDRRGKFVELGGRAVFRRADGSFLVVAGAWSAFPKRERAFATAREAAIFIVQRARAPAPSSSPSEEVG